MKLHLNLNNSNDIYTNANKYLSYKSAGVKFAIISGRRGTGKTTTALIQCFNNYIKKEEQFVYIRRYKTEMSAVTGTRAFDKIVDGLEYKPAAKGVAGFYCEDNLVGYGLTLSTQVMLKSLNFDKVTLIVFDEALLQRGSPYRYLKDEVSNLLNLIHTIVRNRDNYFVMILGNELDIFNPYYEYFNVPVHTGMWINLEKHLICDNVQPSQKLIDFMKSTALYDLTKDTSYGDFAFDGKVLVSQQAKVIAKPHNCKQLFRLVFNNLTLTCNIYWNFDTKDNHMFVELKNKRIIDDMSFIVTENNQPNYLFVQKFKQRYKNYLYLFFFRNRMEYNDYKASQLIREFCEMI